MDSADAIGVPAFRPGRTSTTDAPSCPHYQGSLFDVIDYPWDLMIAHPPCTHLSVSGARHFEAKRMDGRQQAAVAFFMQIVRRSEHIPMTAIENPVCIMSSLYRKPDQIIQPWQFGHGETKATCLWLKGLQLLKPTNIVEGRENRIHRMPPSEDRWKLRSKTFSGVAAAMAGTVGGEMIYNHGYTEYFRQSTETVTKTPGITQIRRICFRCGKSSLDAVKVKGTGTSRHNPSRYKYKECKS